MWPKRPSLRSSSRSSPISARSSPVRGTRRRSPGVHIHRLHQVVARAQPQASTALSTLACSVISTTSVDSRLEA